jgi:phosphoenolpyruvate synthase/pyruvate phosphate dikinase
MKGYKPTGIKWKWLFRRNVSLLQCYLWTEAIRGKKLSPQMDFFVPNSFQIFIGEKGNFYFFDEKDMEEKNSLIQKQILSKTSFAKNIRKKCDLLYEEIFDSSIEMNKADLTKMPNMALLQLFRRFRAAFGKAGIITMPGYGADACIDPNFILAKYLEKKLDRKYTELVEEINALAICIKPTSAYLERKEFLEIAVMIKNKSSTRKQIESAIDNHISKYQWMNTEYLSPEWPKEKYWSELIKLQKQHPAKLLEEHIKGYNRQIERKRELIKYLSPPADVMKVIDALGEFMREFDWSKAHYCMAYLNWRKFIKEIAKRRGCSEIEMLFHTPDEIEAFLGSEKRMEMDAIKKRRGGFALLMKNEKIKILTTEENEIRKIAKKEGVFEVVFGIPEILDELKGAVACPGKVRGKAVVVQKVEDLSQLKKGDILITYMTTMEYTRAFHTAGAIVTDEGGMFCHAAIVAREFNVPCIVGTKKATKVFKTGDLVEVDATKGIVRKVK